MFHVGKLSSLLRARYLAVSGTGRLPAIAVNQEKKQVFSVLPTSITKIISNGRNAPTTGIQTYQQVRCCNDGSSDKYPRFHHDTKAPDFSSYRRDSVSAPNCPNDTADERRGFTYLVTAIGCAATVYGFKSHMLHYLTSMSATADVLALAKIEIKLSEIPEGRTNVYKWRSKPLFVRHRSKEDIDRERATPLDILRDPEKDEDRFIKPEWFVVIGVCTHLGCVPIPDAGDYHGFYCPCHGSHFDGSGRARAGPAPSNLVVPPHEFPDEGTLVVG